MGYIRGFVHGAVAGTVVGLCIAPQPGERTRAQLAVLARAARDGYGVASRTMKQMAPVLSGAASVARSQAERLRRREEAASGSNGQSGSH
jgi:gas vesicle protein